MRVVLLLICIAFNLFAVSKYDVIEDILISKDNKTFVNIETLNDDTDFEKIYLKIKLDKNILKHEEFYLRVIHGFNHLKSTNTKAKQEDNETTILLDKTTPSELLLHLESKFDDVFLDINIHTKEEFDSIQKNEYLFYGISYGIIFCAFLYNLIFFFYNRSKTFLYYSCFQLSLLFLLLLSVMTPAFLKPLYSYFPVPEIVGQLTLLFAIIFNRSFLDLKSYFPKFDKFLLFLTYAFIFDIVFIIIFGFTILPEFLPVSIIIFLLLLSSFLVYRQGLKIAFFYILGWSVIFLSILFVEFESLNYPDMYALHFGLPLESLILSFTLGYKMKELEKQKAMQQQMLIHQNKLASMGEMINNIAHQYRQPLTHLGYILMNINSAYEHNELDNKYLKEKIDTANKQLQFMSDTIDNFRDFYKPNKEKEEFYINKAVSSAVEILKPIFEENKIGLFVSIDKSISINGYENEYSQVILNLLSNAKDSLIDSKVLNPQIEIGLELEDEITRLYIKDNGVGIKDTLKEKIFEPYFSTKSKSSGIGLYMSSAIIHDHFEGKLYLDKSSAGATFVIEV